MGRPEYAVDRYTGKYIVCLICGAVVTQVTRELHDSWHAKISP